MGTGPTTSVGQLASLLVAVLTSDVQTKNANALLTYNNAVAEAKRDGTPAPTPPMLTKLNAAVASQFATLVESGTDPNTLPWGSAYFQYQYTPITQPPPSAQLSFVPIPSSPGLYEAMTGDGSWNAGGTKTTWEGMTLQKIILGVTPMGPSVAWQQVDS